MSKELVSGIAGGLVGGFIASGLMKIPAIRSSKEVIEKKLLSAGESVTLKPLTTYKFSIILFHGDGDVQVNITVKVDGVEDIITADTQAIEVLANQTIEIIASNSDTLNPRNTCTIEILSLSW
jgi:hypothetical protein